MRRANRIDQPFRQPEFFVRHPRRSNDGDFVLLKLLQLFSGLYQRAVPGWCRRVPDSPEPAEF